MTPKDVCQRCDGVGLLVNLKNLKQLVFPCPACEGVGWDPDAIKREVQQIQSSLDNVKL